MLVVPRSRRLGDWSVSPGYGLDVNGTYLGQLVSKTEAGLVTGGTR